LAMTSWMVLARMMSLTYLIVDSLKVKLFPLVAIPLESSSNEFVCLD